jgi:hypothetical protein
MIVVVYGYLSLLILCSSGVILENIFFLFGVTECDEWKTGMRPPFNRHASDFENAV